MIPQETQQYLSLRRLPYFERSLQTETCHFLLNHISDLITKTEMFFFHPKVLAQLPSVGAEC